MSGWAAAAQIVGQLAGSYMQAEGAKDAAEIQSRASRDAVLEQQRQYELARKDSAPWREAGAGAINQIRVLLGQGRSYDDIANDLRASHKFSGQRKVGTQEGITFGDASVGGGAPVYENFTDEDSLAKEAQRIYQQEQSQAGALNKKFTLADFWDDPVTKASYQSGLDLGAKTINQNAGATGMRRSGQTLKALTQFGTDYTGQKAGDSYNRFYADQDRIFNRLSGVAGTGQTAALNTAALGQNSATNVGNLLTAAGNARGAAAIAGGNAWANGINNISSWYQQQQYINALNNRNNTTTTNSNPYGFFTNSEATDQ